MIEEVIVYVLATIVRMISAMNKALGQAFSWLSLAIVLVCFTVVVLRYLFSIGFIWMQDLYVWLNAVMFTGVAGYALMKNVHVRVDIFYRPAALRRKAWIDLIGFVIFMLPFAVVTVMWSLPFVERSWKFWESSRNIGGMPGLYVIKSFILVFAAVVVLQGFAIACRSVLVLAGREDLLPDDLRYTEEG